MNRSAHRLFLLPAVLLGTLCTGPAADAITWGPQAAGTLTGISLADRPELAGPTIYENSLIYTTFNHTTSSDASFRLDEWVVRETAAGTLDFYFRITAQSVPLPPDATGLWTTSCPGYSAFPVSLVSEVDYRSDLLPTGWTDPLFVWSAGDRYLRFGAVHTYPTRNEWGLPNEVAEFALQPGMSTPTFVIRTTSLEYDTGGYVDNIGVGRYPGLAEPSGYLLAPPTPMPEPASLVLMPLALGALGWRLRRRA